MALNFIWNIVVLVLAIPIGYLLAYLCNDELIDGRKWFKVLIIISIIGALGSYIFDYLYMVLTFCFIFIVSFISLIKSKDKSLTKRR